MEAQIERHVCKKNEICNKFKEYWFLESYHETYHEVLLHLYPTLQGYSEAKTLEINRV